MIWVWLAVLVAAIVIELLTPSALVSIWFAAGKPRSCCTGDVGGSVLVSAYCMSDRIRFASFAGSSCSDPLFARQYHCH